MAFKALELPPVGSKDSTMTFKAFTVWTTLVKNMEEHKKDLCTFILSRLLLLRVIRTWVQTIRINNSIVSLHCGRITNATRKQSEEKHDEADVSGGTYGNITTEPEALNAFLPRKVRTYGLVIPYARKYCQASSYQTKRYAQAIKAAARNPAVVVLSMDSFRRSTFLAGARAAVRLATLRSQDGPHKS